MIRGMINNFGYIFLVLFLSSCFTRIKKSNSDQSKPDSYICIVDTFLSGKLYDTGRNQIILRGRKDSKIQPQNDSLYVAFEVDFYNSEVSISCGNKLLYEGKVTTHGNLGLAKGIYIKKEVACNLSFVINGFAFTCSNDISKYNVLRIRLLNGEAIVIYSDNKKPRYK